MRLFILNSSTVIVLFLVSLALSPFVFAQVSQPCTNLSSYLTVGSQDGMTNNEVSALQRFLKARYSLSDTALPVTGYFGSITESYVKLFQTENGIEATGTVGPITRAKIRALCGTQNASTQSQSMSGSMTSTSGTTQTNGTMCANVAVPACTGTLKPIVSGSCVTGYTCTAIPSSTSVSTNTTRSAASGSSVGTSVADGNSGGSNSTTGGTSGCSMSGENTSASDPRNIQPNNMLPGFYPGPTECASANTESIQAQTNEWMAQTAAMADAIARWLMDPANQPPCQQNGTCGVSDLVKNAKLGANFTVGNGQSEITVNAGDYVSYLWTSSLGSTYSGTYSQDSSSCGVSGTGPFPWTAINSLNGSMNAQTAACQKGHTYVITFTVTDASGATASDSVTVRVQ